MTDKKIDASGVRFIKLGSAGRYELAALEDKRLYLGYHGVPDHLCRNNNWDAVYEHFLDEGHQPHVARIHARQVEAFYTEPKTCLWVTFIDGCMWWTFAKDGVAICDEELAINTASGERGPSRYRSCVENWRNKNIHGTELHMNRLPGFVTKTASGFQGTICQMSAAEAIIRIINDEVDPNVKEALGRREALIESIEKVIPNLHWKDFETLIDLVFQRSGWPRVSRLGGSQRFIEFELENPITDERAFAQVKSEVNQNTFNKYLEQFDRDSSYKQMFFVYHTARSNLVSDHPDVFVWNGRKVAEMAVRTGLVDWILEKAG